MKTLILTITEALHKAKRTAQSRRYVFFMNKIELCSLIKSTNSNMETTGLQQSLSMVLKYGKRKNLMITNLTQQQYDNNK